MKTLTGIAAVAVLMLLPSTIAQAQLPVGEADGVRMVAQRGGVLVIFGPRAEKLRRRYAGKILEISCTKMVEGGAHIGAEGLRVPKSSRRVFAGDHRGVDYCRLWRPARTVRRHGNRQRHARTLLVSVPLTQRGAVFVDEEEKTRSIGGVWVLGSILAERLKLDGYPTYEQVISEYPKVARAVVALAGPEDSPPAGKVGLYSDGAAHFAVAILSGSGRRLFIENEGDVLSTNVYSYLFNLPE